MEKFRVRPGYGSKELLVELCGDHRTPGFPNVLKLLAESLRAKQQDHPTFSSETMIANDRYFTYWSYANGKYEIDDDVWACFITAADGNPQVIADIEQALTTSGRFEKEDVDYDKYT